MPHLHLEYTANLPELNADVALIRLNNALVVGVMEKQGGPGVDFDVEGSGYGFKVVREIAAARAQQPTTCKMVRLG